MPDFLSIGHRGAAGHEPENTLRSVRRAIELGAHAVEIDVQLVDGHLVVFHDATLGRITGARGRLARTSFARLRELDAGGGERIPTLEEVCDAVDRRVLLQIELKGRHTADAVAASIARRVRHCGWRYGDFLVSSFHHRELARLAGGPIPLGILYAKSPARFPRLASALGAVSIHCRPEYATPALLARAHERGLKVFVFTVNDRRAIARLRDLGVDGVFTDYPERARFP
ncbi:MAG TPA: glycerophosphodiester phosphodiesterase [Luteolibacter sp.]